MISINDFIHPEDEAARRQLEAIPGFTAVLKGFLKIGYEQYFHGTNMANKIRFADNQLPEIYKRLHPICKKLEIEEPEFYLEMNPVPNAYTYGDTRIFLTITSGLLEYLDEDELDAVLAHECGHIVCRHVLYHTMADLLLKGADALGVVGNLVMPIQLALLYWQRRSELSADRAAAAVMGSAEPVVETLIRLSGGPKSITKDVNIDAYAAQAEAYETLQESKWDKLLQTLAVMQQSHPFPAVRVREIRNWTSESNFENLVNLIHNKSNGIECPACGKTISGEWKFCKFCGKKII